MRTFSLASGSSGNCIYIESKEGFKLLVDCGLSFSKTEEILKEKNIDINSLDAIFITHEHADHVAGIKSFVNKLDCTYYCSKGTYEMLDIDKEFRIVKHHEIIEIPDGRVFVLKKPHDAKEAVSYVFDLDEKKVGIFTDLGHVTEEIAHTFKLLDVAYLEANYCAEYIRKNCRDLNQQYLNRLMSNKGHLGIDQTNRLLEEAAHDNQIIVLSHVSENTNSYENTYMKIRECLNSCSKSPQVLMSFQGEPSSWIE